VTTWFPSDQRGACTGGETLVPGELRGFRRWEFSASTPLGLSSLRGSAWKVRETAECISPVFAMHATPAPAERCGCGIYGWYRPDLLDVAATCPCGCGLSGSGVLDSSVVFGTIAATGRVLLGTRGFRAARARITGVVVEPHHGILRTTLAGAGVALFDTLDELVAAQPPQDDLASLGVDVDAISPAAPTHRPMLYAAGGFATYTLTFDTTPIVEALRRTAESMARAQRQMEANSRRRRLFLPSPASEPLDPPARALALRRARNTGPKPLSRAPRSIDARGAR
jgi:hypothetical protein